MPMITEVWVKEDRETVKYYRSLAAQCKSRGLNSHRREYIELALVYRQRAMKWSSWVAN